MALKQNDALISKYKILLGFRNRNPHVFISWVENKFKPIEVVCGDDSEGKVEGGKGQWENFQKSFDSSNLLKEIKDHNPHLIPILDASESFVVKKVLDKENGKCHVIAEVSPCLFEDLMRFKLSLGNEF